MYWQEATETTLRPLLQASRLGLLVDLDGTLSPIVPVPDHAKVTPENLRLLNELAHTLPLVAVVSGRSAPDLYQRVGLGNLVYIGNHGMEMWDGSAAVTRPEAGAFRAALERVIQQLQPHLIPGMILDDKGASISLHYRQTGDFDTDAFRALIQAIAAQNQMAMFEGRKVFEFRPPIAINKGSILEQLAAEYQLDAAVFIGDDTTDADALRMARHLRLSNRCYAIGLGVEADETPDVVLETADLLVQGVSGVESFLEWLLRSLSASAN